MSNIFKSEKVQIVFKVIAYSLQANWMTCDSMLIILLLQRSLQQHRSAFTHLSMEPPYTGAFTHEAQRQVSSVKIETFHLSDPVV